MSHQEDSFDKPLRIPSDLSEVDESWILALVSKTDGVSDVKKVAAVKIERDAIAAREGVLSDFCKVFVHLERHSARPFVANFFIKVAPKRMRDIVSRHKLFLREITFYKEVLPRLHRFVIDRSANQKSPLQHFSVPRFVFGDDDGVSAVLVLEDLSSTSSRSFVTFDPMGTLLFDLPHMEAAVLALAEFHAICLAHDLLEETRLVDRFPIFHPKHLMWFQDDMLAFLEELTSAAVEFLDSIPGEQETARRYRQRMADPLRIFDDDKSDGNAFRCLLHGDSWHNNFMFRKMRGGGVKAAIVDWQVSYYGNAVSDLCYLLYSTSTSLFRRCHADELLTSYFERLIQVVRSLGVTHNQFNPTFREFDQQFQNCLPLTLLFCGSAEDLKLQDLNGNQDEEDGGENQCKNLSDRRTSVATDQEIRALDLKDAAKPKFANPRIARSLRRRNYLDACREAVRRGVM